jgi:ABC-type branched-subunit amino acid transport system substrate-binding protein
MVATCLGSAKMDSVKVIMPDACHFNELITSAKIKAENIIVSSLAWGWGEADTMINQFQKDFQAKYNREAPIDAGMAYDALTVLANAVTAASSFNSSDVKTKLQDTRYLGVTGLTTFDEFGEVQKGFSLDVIKDGMLVPLLSQ